MYFRYGNPVINTGRGCHPELNLQSPQRVFQARSSFCSTLQIVCREGGRATGDRSSYLVDGVCQAFYTFSTTEVKAGRGAEEAQKVSQRRICVAGLVHTALSDSIPAPAGVEMP